MCSFYHCAILLLGKSKFVYINMHSYRLSKFVFYTSDQKFVKLKIIESFFPHVCTDFKKKFASKEPAGTNLYVTLLA